MSEEPWDHIQNANVQLRQFTIGQWTRILALCKRPVTYQSLLQASIDAGYANLPADYLQNTLNEIQKQTKKEEDVL